MTHKHTYRHDGLPGALPEELRVNPYTVPDGYFDALHRRTLSRCRDLDAAPAPFGVPDGYFDGLEDRIRAAVTAQRLKEQVSESGFAVPEGYFRQSEDHLLAELRLREMVTDSGFTVPTGYFDALHRRLTKRTGTETVTTPIRTLRRTRWVAYAAAACLAVVLAIAGLLKRNEDVRPAHTLAAVSDQEILQYLELYGTTDDLIYISAQLDELDERPIGEDLSEADIEAYLEHTL